MTQGSKPPEGYIPTGSEIPGTHWGKGSGEEAYFNDTSKPAETPEIGIPKEIKTWITKRLDEKYDISRCYPPGWKEYRSCMEVAYFEMYLHLMAEKPRGMRWVKASERKPEIGKLVIVRTDNQKLITHTTNEGNENGWGLGEYWFWDDTEWLDESADQDEIESVRSQLAQEKKNFDRVVGENIRLEERIAIADLRRDAAKALFEMEHEKYRKSLVQLTATTQEADTLRATIARQAQTISDQEATTAIAFAEWILNNTYGRQSGEVSALYDEFIKAR